MSVVIGFESYRFVSQSLLLYLVPFSQTPGWRSRVVGYQKAQPCLYPSYGTIQFTHTMIPSFFRSLLRSDAILPLSIREIWRSTHFFSKDGKPLVVMLVVYLAPSNASLNWLYRRCHSQSSNSKGKFSTLKRFHRPSSRKLAMRYPQRISRKSCRCRETHSQKSGSVSNNKSTSTPECPCSEWNSWSLR